MIHCGMKMVLTFPILQALLTIFLHLPALPSSSLLLQAQALKQNLKETTQIPLYRVAKESQILPTGVWGGRCICSLHQLLVHMAPFTSMHPYLRCSVTLSSNSKLIPSHISFCAFPVARIQGVVRSSFGYQKDKPLVKSSILEVNHLERCLCFPVTCSCITSSSLCNPPHSSEWQWRKITSTLFPKL